MQKIVAMEDMSLDERIRALDNEKQVVEPSKLVDETPFELESQPTTTQKACCVVFCSYLFNKHSVYMFYTTKESKLI